MKMVQIRIECVQKCSISGWKLNTGNINAGTITGFSNWHEIEMTILPGSIQLIGVIKLKLTVLNDSNFDEFITLSFDHGQGHFVSHVHLKKTPISGPSYP